MTKDITTLNFEAVEEISQELDHMVKVPESGLTVKQQEIELAMSREHIKRCMLYILDYENYLLDRLKHAEIERFKCYER